MGFNILNPGGAGGGSTIDGFDPTAKARIYTECTGPAEGGFTSYTTGTGAAVAVTTTNSSKDHPGLIRERAGTTTSGVATHYAPGPFLFGNGFTYRASIYIEDLSTVTEEFVIYAGLKNDVTAGAGTHGCYFVYDRLSNVNWLAICDDDTGTTTTDTSTAVTEDTWIELAIVMNDAYDSCAFYIDGALVATNATAANFPDTGTDSGYVQVSIQKTAGTTDRILYHDYTFYEATAGRSS